MAFEMPVDPREARRARRKSREAAEDNRAGGTSPDEPTPRDASSAPPDTDRPE